MSALLKTRWLPIAALSLVLAAILAFLHVKERAYSDTEYFENVVLLRQLKQIDAELNGLKSRSGANPPAKLSADPSLVLQRLADSAGRHRDGAWQAAIDALGREIRNKTVLIEQFDSRDALLRKSLILLPAAADDVQRKVGHAAAFKNVDRTQMRAISDEVNRVVLQTLTYNQTPSQDRAAAIQSELTKLTGARAALPSEAVDALDTFASHARTVLREHVAATELLNGIAAVPVAARIDEVDNALNRQQRKAAGDRKWLRGLSIGISAVLLLLLAYVAVSLARGYALMSAINRALKDANAGLEHKLQEQTQELAPALKDRKESEAQHARSESASPDGRAVAGVAHDINASMNRVKGNLEIVASRMGDIANLEDLCRSAVHILSNRGAQTMDLQTRLRQVYEVALRVSESKASAELGDLASNGIRSINRMLEAVVKLESLGAPDRGAEAGHNLHEKKEAPAAVVSEESPAPEAT